MMLLPSKVTAEFFLRYLDKQLKFWSISSWMWPTIKNPNSIKWLKVSKLHNYVVLCSYVPTSLNILISIRSKKIQTYLFLFSQMQLSIWINSLGGKTLVLEILINADIIHNKVRLQSCSHCNK